ncbi:MAG: MotA/TolQ/ExbB proton channel family protein [Verrucomicrobiaceae bacterium]
MLRTSILCSLALATRLMADPTTGLESATSGSASRLEEATKQLADLRLRIESDTLPLTKQLNELEQKLGKTKTEFEDVDRVLASRQLENTNLTSSVKLKNEENAYLASIMDEFTRGLETRLFPGEVPRFKPIIDEAKLVMTNTDMGAGDKFKRQIAVVKAALARVEDLVGGSRFPGKAVDSKGNVVEGTFAMVGPGAYFAAKFGDLSGIAVAQTSSPNPLVRDIPSPADTAAPHEKLMMWFEKMMNKQDTHNRPGVMAVIASAEGWLPMDPSRGAALRDLVHKFNLIETFIHGGWIMWPILFASVAAFTVVLERGFFIFNENRKRSRKMQDLFFLKCEKHDLDGAVLVAKSTKDFVVRALGYALEHRDSSLHSALIYSSQTAIKRFTRGLPVLDTVITLAPMLGLLGTVTGMMGSFQAISGSDGNPTAVMAGISEALIATAAGLGIALISLLPYNYLNAQIEDAQKDMETASARLELLIQVSEQFAIEKARISNLPPPSPQSGSTLKTMTQTKPGPARSDSGEEDPGLQGVPA